MLGNSSPGDVIAGRSRAVRARDQAGDAFDQFLIERGAKPVAPEAAASLIAAGTHGVIVGDLLNVIADMGYRAQVGSAVVPSLRAQAQLLLASFVRLADRLDGAPSPFLAGAGVSDAALREAALASLRRWRDDPARTRSAVATVIAGEWLQQMGELAADLEAAVAAAAEGARTPWWRKPALPWARRSPTL